MTLEALSVLTDKQIRVAKGVLAGMPDREIGLKLGIRPTSVKQCRQRIARRLRVVPNGRDLRILLARKLLGLN